MWRTRTHLYVWKRIPRYKSFRVDLGTFRSIIYYEMQIFSHYLLFLDNKVLVPSSLKHQRNLLRGCPPCAQLENHDGASTHLCDFLEECTCVYKHARALCSTLYMRSDTIIFTHMYLLLFFVRQFLFNSKWYIFPFRCEISFLLFSLLYQSMWKFKFSGNNNNDVYNVIINYIYKCIFKRKFT